MKKKILSCSIILILIMSVFSSCAGAANDMAIGDNMFAPGAKEEAVMMPSLDAAPEYGYTGGYYVDDFSNKDYDGKYVENEIADNTGANNGDYKEKIIKNVSIAAQTKEYEKSLDGILSALNQYGGYEESINSSGKSYYSSDYYTRTARMTLRIPSENLDKFLGDIGTLINITSQTSSQSNVTSQYYDTKARIEVLESERAAYEEMLKMAKEVSEVLQIKDRLYQTIEEIEASKTRLNVYDNKVSFSTVTITIDEVREYVEVPTVKVTFGERIANSFKESWKDFANGFQNFVVWFVGAIPTLLVMAVIIGVIVAIPITIVKKVKKKNKENKGE